MPASWLTNSWRPTDNARATSRALAASSTPISTVILGRRRASRKAPRYSTATTGSSHRATGLPNA